MSNARTTLHRIAILTLALAAAPAATEAAASLGADVTGPVVIGDQLFAGGTVVLRPVGTGSLVQVLIDGRPVASLFRDGATGRAIGSSSRLVLRADARGLTHLVGVREGAPLPNHTAHRALRVATVAPGLVTVPPYEPGPPRDASRAARRDD
ncbi:MAG: hypothetical protein MUC67_00585 [Acidobacteria bacterium]|jgi:hypothetical protein|nr:hypothetical protein [Acidobacteriota bacterium]MCU0252954.1 hypothetical protein [Acidobacteriota bacterium]